MENWLYQGTSLLHSQAFNQVDAGARIFNNRSQNKSSKHRIIAFVKTSTLSAMFRLTATLVGLLLLAACASTSSIAVNRKAPLRAYQVVNVISTPDQAGDISAALEAALQQHGFKTRINPATQGVGTLTARFQDSWKRNGMTYLGKLNLELLDVDTKTVLVSSNWQNTSGHQAQSVPDVVDQLIASMLGRLPARRADAQTPTQMARAGELP